MRNLIPLYISFTFSLFSCNTYQRPRGTSYENGIEDMPSEPGKCYAKCLSPDVVDEQIFTFDIYTGDDPEITSKYVKTTEIELAPESSKWVKKKADRNCTSTDPNDCLVWCMVKEPAQTVTVKNMLIDTSVTKDYITETHNIDFVSVSGGNQVWQPVLCNPTDTQLEEIQLALIDEGFDLSREMLQRKFGKASKKALLQFQEDNLLHTGGLTEESMDLLGVDY